MTAVGGPEAVIQAVRAAGGHVGPRSMWAGSWMLKPAVGYSGLDKFYASCKADGVQPMVLLWIIGDDDGAKFLAAGVQDMYQGVWKTRADGVNMAREVARRAKAAGVAPIVVLNNEFNKGALQASQDFARFYDDQVAAIRAECPSAKIVFPPGAWGDLAALAAYYKPQVDRSDMVGLQCGYFKPRRTDDLALVAFTLAMSFAKFPAGKPRILYDVFLSTYGGAYAAAHPFQGGDGRALEQRQAHAIYGLAAIPDLEAIVYRDLKDNPTFDVANYGGWAERFVGVVRGDGSPKPARDALVALSRPALATQAQVDAATKDAAQARQAAQDAQRRLDAARAALTALQAALAT